MFIRRRRNADLLLLVLALVVQTGLLLYAAWQYAPHAGALAAPWSPSVWVAGLFVSGVLTVLVSFGIVRHERGLRRRAELRMARLVESADQAQELVTIVDRRGRIEYVNRAVEETTGYAKAELIGSRALRWFPWHAEDQALEPMRTRLLAGGSFRGTVICRSKDGKPFLLQEHVAPMQGPRSAQRFLSTPATSRASTRWRRGSRRSRASTR
jgi:PAS domain S-box-containing protein